MKVETDLFSTIDIATSGLKAYSKQMEVTGSNLANMQTTNVGNGQPYRRLIARMKPDEEEGPGGVSISEIVGDQSDFQRILMPGHPDADENGYVKMPNINWPQEMIDLNMASRAYQANAAILRRYQKMVESSLELLR